MKERRRAQRVRALRSAKIIFNNRQSVIDCAIRNLSDEGGCLQLQSQAGVPDVFDLRVDGEKRVRPCHLIWQSRDKVGISFHDVSQDSAKKDEPKNRGPMAKISEWRRNPETPLNIDLIRGELLTLRAALDEVEFGIVLLDNELRAQFINRAFRTMWRLPDAKADGKPAFVALMYHGRDARAYAVPAKDVDAYVAERVAFVKAGAPTPVDLRLTNGEVIRFQCAVLPAGGRMLSYTYVTDIARSSDDLAAMRAALDSMEAGVLVLDSNLNTRFMNRAARGLWKVSADRAEARPSFAQLVDEARTNAGDSAADDRDPAIASRLERVRVGDQKPADLRMMDGRVIRSQCAAVPGGGRVLTYADVTDLIEQAERLERLAATDEMTGLRNRRHFLALAVAEWSRFKRHRRPLSLLMIDIEGLSSINERFGYETGDQVIVHAAILCSEEKRGSDLIGRIGGGEFAVLLPETDLAQASGLAERLAHRAAQRPCPTNGTNIAVKLNVGAAEATSRMSDFGMLMKTAEQARRATSSARRGVARKALVSNPESEVAAS
ncbi:MAG: PAS-domain containing protein [Methylobacteriaceae bacterium]|nr:PAS-domain containing protein [Methylobacteriaceae bacterium]